MKEIYKDTYIECDSVYGCKTQNLFLQTDKANSLVVIFPGKNYSCNSPLLYYAQMEALFSGFDVLCLEYGFSKAKAQTTLADLDKMIDEIQAVIKSISKTYEKTYFISKSLGTLFAGELSKRLYDRCIKNLFLTPLEKTAPYMNENSVAITGSSDSSFNKCDAETIKAKSNCKIIIIPDSDHSLETEISTAMNLEILQQIVQLYKSFLAQHR